MHLVVNWTWIILFFVILIGLRYLKEYFIKKNDNAKDIHFKDKDTEVVSEAFSKIGEVINGSHNEQLLNAQNKQNNVEIHELTKKVNILETNFVYIVEQLNDIMGEIKKRG